MMIKTHALNAIRILLFLGGFYIAYQQVFSFEPELFAQSIGTQRIECISYSAQHRIINFTPEDRKNPWLADEKDIDADLRILKRFTDCLRLYTPKHGGRYALEAAVRMGFDRIYLGADISNYHEENLREIDDVIALAAQYPQIKIVFIGNEVYDRRYQELLNVDDKTYAAYINKAQDAIAQPVAIAEPLRQWLDPAKGMASELVALHIHPYWGRAPIENVYQYIRERIEQMQARYPGKEIMIAEIGWPKEGPQRWSATPSIANQQKTLDAIKQYHEETGIRYVWFEAFDQPWKAEQSEGRVGAHWGLLKADQLRIGGGYRVAFALMACAIMAVLWRSLSGLNWAGAIISGLVPPVLTGLFFVPLIELRRTYELLRDIPFGIFAFFNLLAFLVILYRWQQITEILGSTHYSVRQLLRRNAAHRLPEAGQRPYFVSIHVPCRNEDPAQVIACIQSLQRLDYPCYEIIVLDNNTEDEALYAPVEAYARSHPERLRFFHRDDVQGYKAGALNLCLSYSDPRAEIIAVVDSDYRVDPGWLRDLSPYFHDPRVACVQAPQDYMPSFSSRFQRWIYNEYLGFFKIGMVQRALRNAIIHHGTMILLRKSALAHIGGWPTETITEDSDCGMHLLEAGFVSLYIPRSYGKGQLPFFIREYQAQRFRWAYGALQMCLKHRASLFGRRTTLTVSQRLHYIMGWLPWVTLAIHPIAMIVFTLHLISAHIDVDSLINPYFFMPFACFMLSEMLFSFLTYRGRTTLSSRDIWRNFFTGCALVVSLGFAFWIFLSRRHVAFRSTHKTQAMASSSALMRLFTIYSRIIAFMSVGCFLLGWALVVRYYDMGFDIWPWLLAANIFVLPSASAYMLSRMDAARNVNE